MTQEMNNLRDFFVAKLTKRDITENDADTLTDFFYPNEDGSNRGMVAASRQFAEDFAKWQKNPTPKQEGKREEPVIPLSDEEIEAIARIF